MGELTDKEILSTEDIVNYVIHSPQNTNPNILRGMVNTLVEEAAGSVLPDPSEASAGDVLALNDEKQPTWTSSSSEQHLYVQARTYNANLTYYEHSYTGTILIYAFTPTNTEIDILTYVQSRPYYPFVKGSMYIEYESNKQSWTAYSVDYNSATGKYGVGFGGGQFGEVTGFQFYGTLSPVGNSNQIKQLF